MRIIFLLLISLPALCQDLSGTWEGSGNMTPYIKLVIVRSGGNYVGYAYDEGMGYCKTNFLGTFDSASQKLRGKSMGFIEKTLMHGQSMFHLHYSGNGNTAMLKGTASPKTALAKIASFGMFELITLTRTKFSIDTTAYMKKALDGTATPEQPETPPEISSSLPSPADEDLRAIRTSRQTDTVKIVDIAEKKVKVRVIDNGIEDGDSISIFCDDRIVIKQHRVSHLPFEFAISFGPAEAMHSITLVARNLGAIPPNTATVIIESGNKIYTINASSGMQKNAMIQLRFKPG